MSIRATRIAPVASTWAKSDDGESDAPPQEKKLEHYKALRSKDKARMQSNVAKLGFAVMFVGFGILLAGFLTDRYILPLLSTFFFGTGITLVCAAHLDWDAFMRRH